MKLESYSDNNQKSPENIKTLEELIEKIKSPEELLLFMEKNIKYGYIGKKNKKIYDSGDSAFDADFDSEYYLQTPPQLLNSKHGVCWDQAELERHWFSEKGYDFQTYFLMFAKEISNSLPTHTFLAYKNQDKFYWFENSFEENRGIHEYENFDALIKDVKSRHFEAAKKWNGATDEDFNDLAVCKYTTPEFGSNPNEFINNIMNSDSIKQKNQE